MEVRSPAGVNRVSDETLGCIFAHLDSPGDRRAVSQVCQQWRRVDANTRKHVSIANCYSVAPAALSRRFPNLRSLKIKGKPRAFEYELLVQNWGGYARPWVAEIARGYSQRLQSLWLRRMHVTDADLTLLAQSCSESLHTLKLHKCSGFSSSGIYDITAYCRGLKVLYLEESVINPSEKGGEWLHELALYNTTLEDLNFQYLHQEFDDVSVTDLETIAENCKSLRSLKVSEIDILDMKGVLSKVHGLLEYGTGCCASIGDSPGAGEIDLPRTIIGLSGLYELNEIGLPMVAHLLPNLKKLDLKYTLLNPEGHVEILRHCVSLEELEVRNVLGDDGLITVARTCKNLRRIRVDDSDGEGFLSPLGIMAIAQNCTKLEFLVMYVVDINNATLKAFGDNCSNLKDCRFVLLLTNLVSDLPLDEGVRGLLKGCQKLTRFALYVRHGGLTDRGMGYIGEYGGKLKWILLGCAGESDTGLLNLAVGCHSLERLEMRDCPVTEGGLASAAGIMKNSLKYMWVQGYQATDAGGKVLAMARPFWNVEICSGSSQLPGQLLAYCTLAGPRTDCPPEVDLLSQFAPADTNWEL